jgi:phosphatidylglycerol:prolipoprotein diacylglycerol transferase
VQALLSAISYNPIVHVPIGPLRISPHGVGIAVGFLAGARLMMPTAKKKGISEDAVYTILIRAAIGALIGARVAYVMNHFGDYTSDPIAMVKVWEGGISLLGGIFGAILLALPVARKLRINAWKLLDAAAPGIALGIMIGRIGDLIVGDHLGKPTSFFLGYRCRAGVETASPCVGNVVHQPHLYDFFFATLLLVLLLRLRRTQRYDGFLILVFGACYGVARFIEDFFRIDETHGTGLTGSQWTAIATVLICAAWLTFVRRTPRWGHWDRGLPGTEGPPPTMAAQPHSPDPQSQEIQES